MSRSHPMVCVSADGKFAGHHWVLSQGKDLNNQPVTHYDCKRCLAQKDVPIAPYATKSHWKSAPGAKQVSQVGES